MKKDKYKNSIINCFIIGVLCVVVLYSLKPLLNSGFIYGDDGTFHLLRIKGVTDCIEQGNFSAFIYPNAVNDYGYGSGLFYPNFFIYIPALISMFNVDFQVAYKLFVVIITIVCTYSMYYSTKYITKSKFASLCATVIYILAQYRIHTFYYRSAIGEAIAYIFFPIIVCGIYDIFYEEFKKPWIIGCGFLGLMLCHSISLAIGLVIFFGVCVFFIKAFIKDLSRLIRLIYTGIVVLLLSAFFWGPMLEQLVSGRFGLERPVTSVTENVLSFKELFATTGPGIGMCFLILVVIWFTLDSERDEHNRLKPKSLFFIIGVLLIFATTRYFPWNIFKKLLNPIQFPWRLFGFANAFLAIALAGMIKEVINKKNSKKLIFLIFLVMTAATGASYELGHSYERYGEKLSDYSDKDFSIGYGEWLPLDTNIDLLKEENTQAILSSGEKIEVQRNGNEVSFNYSKGGNSEYIDVPLLFYKGYSANIIDENNESKELNIEISENNNVIRITDIPSYSGKIIVSYTGTSVQKISLYISVITLLSVVIVSIVKRTAKFKSVINNN